MNEVLTEHADKRLVMYLNDRLASSEAKQQHSEHVKLVLEKLCQRKFSANLS